MSISDFERIEQNFCDLDDLPALPGIALQILDKIRNPETSLHSLADILTADPSLSIKTLNFVNSPFFGLSRQITNLPHAISLLGENWLKYIALSFSLVNLFAWGKTKFNYSLFWRHSLEIAVAGRLIAKALARTDTEEIYFLGLIHNMGILAMVQSCPGQYEMVLKKVAEDTKLHHVAENEVYGTNHMEIGAFLVKFWKLPEMFFLPILNHHCPQNIPLRNQGALIRGRIIHLAREISYFLHSERKALSLAMINQLLVDYEMTGLELNPIIEETCSQIEPLLHFFQLNMWAEYDYAQILEESKKEMYRLSFDMAKKIREQQQKIDDLSILAYQDSLTRLVNYRSFKESLNRELAGGRRYGYTNVLALADLDAFKQINDQYGHTAGDYVLQEVSRFFIQGVRETDIVARYGGEEFAFLLTRTCIAEGFEILERLREQLCNLLIEYHGHKIPISMSVGLTAFSGDNTLGANDLIRQADTAMYQSKIKGKNQTIIFEGSRSDLFIL